MSSLDIKYRWADVQTSVGIPYRYPDKVSDHMKEEYSRPSVYCWEVRSPTQSLRAVYVGETDNLARRIAHCLSPGKRQATNLRLKAYFDEAVNKGEYVGLKTLEFEPFQINKIAISAELLGHTHVRRMLENLVLVWLHSSASSGPPMILNQVFTQDIERSKKRVDTASAALRKLGLTDEQITRVVQAVLVKKAKTL